jgi:glycosyltransferase involved in cell wall biosynthesis
MITDRNIVCVASNWFAHPTSKQHVMRALSAANNIAWVNFHASRRPQLSRADAFAIVRRLRKVLGGTQRVAPTIDVLSPLTLPFPENPRVRRFNTWMLARQIRRLLRRLPSRPTQLWLFTPDAPELIARLRPEHTVYYCVDDFAEFDGFDKELMNALERDTVAQADTVIASSQALVEKLSATPRDVHYVPHGVDATHFGRALTDPAVGPPEDCRDLSAPVFGFFGMLSDHVDLELVASVAQARPGWTFVLIGDATRDTSVCTALENVHLLGPRAYAELPAYCKAFDVGIIPFKRNALVKAVNPIKLREYLAAGLPVASTPMQEVERYPLHVHCGHDLPSFIDACERALQARHAGQAGARAAAVADESWTARVAQLSAFVEGVTPTPTRLTEADAPIAKVGA